MQVPLQDDTLKDRGSDPPLATPTAPHLFVVLEAGRPLSGPARHTLSNVDEVIIGRGPERSAERTAMGETGRLSLQLPDPHVSARHARLRQRGTSFVLDDLGSSNGTRVNDQPVSHASLSDGDFIQVGHTLLRLRTALPTPAKTPGDEDHSDVGGAPAMATVLPELAAAFATLARIARASVPILLLGETGSGKELLARAIHSHSGRRGELVAVNCGAIPQPLLESQLFGHVKGAFSGAARDEPGFARTAHGGTLFLDEIGDLPLSSQAALLRVLQEGEVVPVGSTRPVPVDLRVVAATHAPIGELARTGAFREDLLARLSGYRFEALPLWARREDLGLLLASMLSELAPADAHRWTVEPAAARALFAYTWPRNIRELRQCLGAAAALSTDRCIRRAGLPAEVQNATLPGFTPARESRPDTLDRTRRTPSPRGDDALRRTLQDHLTDSQGNVSEVARRMGKARVQVQRWMKRFAIDPETYRR